MDAAVVQGLMIPFAGTSLGAACALFMKKQMNPLLQRALCEIRGKDTKVEYCHSASVSALKTVLEKHTA